MLTELRFQSPGWKAYAERLKVIALGVALILLVGFIIVWGTVGIWREWRQLQPPTVVVDADGVHYLAARRPLTVPWTDIERACLERTIFRAHVIADVSVRSYLVPRCSVTVRSGFLRLVS